MMICSPSNIIKVFCVDDNALVVEALKLQLAGLKDVEWAGAAHDADSLLEQARVTCPDIVLLDIDMPGKDSISAVSELNEICRGSRVLMYSGLLRRDLVDRALDAGAWGYVAKTDGEHDLLKAIRAVASGSMGFSRSIQSILGEA
jgi:DNA-binding NarL/FixJ family response regulator